MLISIDFEYRKSNEKHPELVCCALKGRQHKKALKFWLHDCPSERARLKSVLIMLISEGAVFLSYQATAEARCFLALGINPLDAQWIDLYVEWRQIRNKNDRFLFGPYVDNAGNPCESSSRGPDRNMIGGGLADAIYYFFQADLDASNKDRMRKIILAGGPFDPQTATEILAYCAADIEYLAMLYDAFRANNKYLDAATALRRGRYTACLALTESLGIPIRLDRVANLSQNQASIARHFYLEANKLFPFFLETKRGFVQSYDQFCKFVATKGLEKKWPKTEGGASGRPKYAMNDKTFKKYSHYPEIALLQKCKTSITHVGFFKPARIGEFLECVGSDGRARPWIGPFGTQTGRNAPPASQYVFAMASWLRAIVEPNASHTILGADESAQEFAIAAVLSGDKNMIEAYNSGDPYLGYAKQTGAIAENATRDDPVTDALRDEYKSSVLGIQYSIGSASLAIKMANDCGKPYTEEDGRRFIALHQRTFPEYWSMLDRVRRIYYSGNPIRTRDNWVLFCDNHNERSVGNFPMQGNAASIGRESMIKCWEAGVPVIAPLHDCDYAECAIGDKIEVKKAMVKAWEDATTAIIGDTIKIRVDVKEHPHGELWVEKKAKKTIDALGKFLLASSDCGDLA